MEDPTKKDLQVFGLIWSVIFWIIALYPISKGNEAYLYPAIISLLFAFISMIIPVALKWFYRAWLKFGGLLGFINSKIILFLLFYLIFTPVAIVLKVLRIDLLSKKLDKKAGTYFVKRQLQPNSMKYQF